MSIEWLIAALLATAVALAWWRHRATRRPPGTPPWMPRALWGAELAWAERTFRSQRRRLVARVDRAYRHGGRIVLLELKTRSANAVYDADIIELSVQRAAIEDATGERVAPRAWVLVEDVDSGWRTPHEVELLDDADLDLLTQRYRQLRGGQLHDAEPPVNPSACRSCGHLDRCQARFRDRC
ncbi:PD-(D/E)XK nuclease family protein [Azohydromonas aeria]|uniref:PD-(D/E)XK nuclease family protein n=1 Tax=Azohydromonas aeria TaxID=2590212 RepID=UPI0012F9CCB0|nr:PD-(D/E)XK nuclease family protein [Azohydromonas aeria]